MEKKERRLRLGRNIKARRIEAGHSMRQFAAMVGTSHNYLWEIEAAYGDPAFEPEVAFYTEADEKGEL